VTYELWSAISGNLVGAYSTEEAALEAARRTAVRNGPAYVESLALIVEDDAGDSRVIAEGRQLSRRLGVNPQTV
jgi:hypothetical protein